MQFTIYIKSVCNGIIPHSSSSVPSVPLRLFNYSDTTGFDITPIRNLTRKIDLTVGANGCSPVVYARLHFRTQFGIIPRGAFRSEDVNQKTPEPEDTRIKLES